MSLSTSLPGHGTGLPVRCRGLGILFLVAVLVVYLVLGVLLRELHPPADHPLRPALGRPRRADHALLVFKVDLSLYAFVGVIMLIGTSRKTPS